MGIDHMKKALDSLLWEKDLCIIIHMHQYACSPCLNMFFFPYKKAYFLNFEELNNPKTFKK
jgi:hypothetical protein